MSRVEHLSDDVALYLGDAREIMPGIKDFDAVLTDPPYWVSKSGDVYKGQVPGAVKWAEVGDDVERFDPRPYMLGNVQIFLGSNNYQTHLPGGTWLLWTQSPPERVGGGGMKIDGGIAWCSKVMDMKIFEHKHEPSPDVHPFEKPIPLIAWYLSFIPEARRIFDPFMGGGSIGVAAVEAGKGYDGIELEPQWFDVACRRISAALEARREAA